MLALMLLLPVSSRY